MAFGGFTMGVQFGHQSLDNVVEVPPSEQSVITKLQDCLSTLVERMKGVAPPAYERRAAENASVPALPVRI